MSSYFPNFVIIHSSFSIFASRACMRVAISCSAFVSRFCTSCFVAISTALRIALLVVSIPYFLLISVNSTSVLLSMLILVFVVVTFLLSDKSLKKFIRGIDLVLFK